jgi:PAS domain S-box-containing protein
MRDKGTIINHFQDSISEIFHPNKFSFTEQKPDGNRYSEKITTRNLSFGYISSGKKPTDEVRKLLQNAIQMLAVILDRLSFETDLITRADSLEVITNQQLKDINTKIEELQTARYASLNIIEDLKQEIAERRKAEEALHLKNFVFNDSIAANSIADLNGIINEINNSFLKMWGYADKNEVIGKPITHFLFDEADGLPIITALQNSGEWEGDYKARRKDGSVFTAHGLATLVKDDTGKSVGYQSAVLDFTEKKNQEELIRQLNEELEAKVLQRTEQLATANKELEAFSYSVSHDLRAPLRAVHSFTNILLEDHEKTLDDEGRRICGIISSSAIQMGKLIDDLLSFSRIGRSEVSLGILDMKSLAKSVINEMYGDKSKYRINFKLGKLSKAYGDSNLLRIVLTNLLSNAIKYSSKEPSSEIVISSSKKNHIVTYSVKDNGVGFDMLYAHKLFGVFQRLHSEKEFEGNGVGLAIVQRIILKHGGNVWAEGEIDKGATFYFSLPANEDKRQK